MEGVTDRKQLVQRAWGWARRRHAPSDKRNKSRLIAELSVEEISDMPPGRAPSPGSHSGLGTSPGFTYLHWGRGTSHFTP